MNDLNEGIKTFNTLIGLNEFYIKKLKELSKNGMLISACDTQEKDAYFMEITTKILMETSCQLFGALARMCM